MNIIENFNINGYCNGPVIIKNEETSKLRKMLDENFEFLGFPKTISLFDLKDNKLIEKILEIFNSNEIKNFILSLSNATNSKINFLPKFLIQRNYHVDRFLSPSVGWHRDCGGELSYKYCREILSSDNYVFGKLGIYLQENSIYGGSIDVIPYSHNYIKNKNYIQKKLNGLRLFLIAKLQKHFLKIYKYFSENYFMLFLNAKRLYPKVGSFVLFDSRIIHRGTPIDDSVRSNVIFNSKEHYADVKKKYTKYSLYVDIGNAKALDSYLYDRNKRKNSFKNKNNNYQTNKEIESLIKENKMLKKFLPHLAQEIQSTFSEVFLKYS